MTMTACIYFRDCVTWYVNCYWKNPMYSQYPHRLQYVEIYMDRYTLLTNII